MYISSEALILILALLFVPWQFWVGMAILFAWLAKWTFRTAVTFAPVALATFNMPEIQSFFMSSLSAAFGHPCGDSIDGLVDVAPLCTSEVTWVIFNVPGFLTFAVVIATWVVFFFGMRRWFAWLDRPQPATR